MQSPKLGLAGPTAVSLVLTSVLGGALVGCGGGAKGSADAGAGGAGGGPLVAAAPLVIAADARTPRTTTWSVNYWQWMPAYTDAVTGTETEIAALHPTLMRIGGYNNDANTPDPFDDAAFDHAVAYARAIGAQPIVQVPLLADINGQSPTADTAAAMVTYANVTKSYGLKYFAIGNEPDLYPDQGLVSDPTKPAIPGYTPAAYCTSARAFVTAMKAVDPTIQIVGPDLGWKFLAGTSNDWLTPILTSCGDLFDVITFHRYPFEAAAATLPAAAADAAAFQSVVAMVRGILQKTGYGAKPLALTEMGVAYDATSCVLEASPGTVGSALWLADALGTAMELGLWTSAVWDIADTDGWALGLIGMPPDHTPRPGYYAYKLYADHVGPTLVGVSATPSGVKAHASRNQADNATEIIASNWNEAPTAVAVQITGLASAPATATFVLPAVSIAAIEVPDQGTASAVVYGETQRSVAAGPAALAAGAPAQPSSDGGTGPGAGRVPGTNCASATDGGVVCPTVMLPSADITMAGTGTDGGLTFGAGSFAWGSYSYAGDGQALPSASVTADGAGLHITGGFVPPIPQNWEGLGLYLNSTSCADVSAYTGIEFDFAGSLGGCLLQLGVNFSADTTPSDDPNRGGCNASTCYAPAADVTTAALAATTQSPTVKVPFSSIVSGMPRSTVDPAHLISVQWQLSAPTTGAADAGGCAADFTVENVSFY
ncbi:MAG TPA: hypothetical protein VHG72_14525 [Polyangia bacterium]|nr:hypothetical protein [Polyangia bacterium]